MGIWKRGVLSRIYSKAVSESEIKVFEVKILLRGVKPLKSKPFKP